MNQETIDNYLERRLQRKSNEIQKRFNTLSDQTALFLARQVEEGMSNGRIARRERHDHMYQLSLEFQSMYEDIEAFVFDQYRENYLRSGYVYEQTLGQSVGYGIPTTAVVASALVIAGTSLSIAALMQKYRDGLVTAIEGILLTAALEAGAIITAVSAAFSTARNRTIFMLSEESDRAVNTAREAATEELIDQLQEEERMLLGDEEYDAQLLSSRKDIRKKWISQRDGAVRHEHRILDNQVSDQEGWFYYNGDRARYPKMWADPQMNFGCRCKVRTTILGQEPYAPASNAYYAWRGRLVQTELAEIYAL